MPTLAFISDPHLGNHKVHGGAIELGMNTRCRMALNVLKEAANRAVSHMADAFVVLGDLFDGTRPEPQLIRQVQRILPASSYLLVGNHEQVSSKQGDHALGPLEEVAGVRIVDIDTTYQIGNTDLVCVPFRQGTAYDWLPEAIKDAVATARAPGEARRVLALHIGIRDDSTPSYLQDAPDSISWARLEELCCTFCIDYVMAGHWHQHKKFGTLRGVKGTQVGGLVPTGFDNPGVAGYGSLCFLHTDSKPGQCPIKCLELPGPRFLKALWKGKDKSDFWEDTEDSGNIIFLHLEADPAGIGAAREWLDGEIKAGHLAGGECVSSGGSKEAAAEAAKAAASAACSATTLAEALVAFVKAMPLMPGVDCEAVLAESQKYLKL